MADAEAVQRARDAVTQADVLWFCSPEYNYQIPGGLKNLLDWLSRPTDEHDRTSPSAIRGKHAVICGAAGKSAAAGMRKQLEALLGILGVEVLGGDGLGISLTPGIVADRHPHPRTRHAGNARRTRR